MLEIETSYFSEVLELQTTEGETTNSMLKSRSGDEKSDSFNQEQGHSAVPHLFEKMPERKPSQLLESTCENTGAEVIQGINETSSRANPTFEATGVQSAAQAKVLEKSDDSPLNSMSDVSSSSARPFLDELSGEFLSTIVAKVEQHQVLDEMSTRNLWELAAQTGNPSPVFPKIDVDIDVDLSKVNGEYCDSDF